MLSIIDILKSSGLFNYFKKRLIKDRISKEYILKDYLENLWLSTSHSHLIIKCQNTYISNSPEMVAFTNHSVHY